MKKALFFTIALTLANIANAQWHEILSLYDGNIGDLYTNDSTVFVGTLGEGIYRSTNNGTNLTQVNTGLTNLHITAIAVSGSNIVAGAGNGDVSYSANNGDTWTLSDDNLSNIQALTVKGSTFFAGTYAGKIFRSTNNGVNWTKVNAGLMSDIRAIAVKW